MDKRLIENIRVKKSIEEAMFELLKKKKFSEITVSDIINVSCVARASYYRNYDSKEAVIKSFIERLRDEVEQSVHFSESKSEFFNHTNLVASLEYYLKYKYYILQLYDNGFGLLIQDMINRFVEEILGDMPSSSVERYEIYMITGAWFNTLICWLKNGAKESPNEIVHVFLKFLLGSRIKNEQ